MADVPPEERVAVLRKRFEGAARECAKKWKVVEPKGGAETANNTVPEEGAAGAENEPSL